MDQSQLLQMTARHSWKALKVFHLVKVSDGGTMTVTVYTIPIQNNISVRMIPGMKSRIAKDRILQK